jgi:hypothetical protein
VSFTKELKVMRKVLLVGVRTCTYRPTPSLSTTLISTQAHPRRLEDNTMQTPRGARADMLASSRLIEVGSGCVGLRAAHALATFAGI